MALATIGTTPAFTGQASSAFATPSSGGAVAAPDTGSRASQTGPTGEARQGARLLRIGSRGSDVAALKVQLRDMKYLVDRGDVYTQRTADAVMAFQKVNGLQRDGVAGPQTRRKLRNPSRFVIGSGASNRIVVDKSQQAAAMVKGGRIAYILNVSTGEPGRDTPVGRRKVEWKVDGWDPGPYGPLYKPSYFTEDGIGVHGSPSVPAYAASHGCVRVPMEAADRVYRDLKLGREVNVRQ